SERRRAGERGEVRARTAAEAETASVRLGTEGDSRIAVRGEPGAWEPVEDLLRPSRPTVRGYVDAGCVHRRAERAARRSTRRGRTGRLLDLVVRPADRVEGVRWIAPHRRLVLLVLRKLRHARCSGTDEMLTDRGRRGTRRDQGRCHRGTQRDEHRKSPQWKS